MLLSSNYSPRKFRPLLERRAPIYLYVATDGCKSSLVSQNGLFASPNRLGATDGSTRTGFNKTRKSVIRSLETHIRKIL